MKFNIPLVFLHVPKCGGTTISSWLEGVGSYGFNYIEHYPKDDLDEIKICRTDNSVISGHFLRHKGRSIEDSISFDVSYCSVIRDPLDILVSYYFWSSRERHQWTTEVSLYSFLNWVASDAEKDGCFKNPILDALPLWNQSDSVEDYMSKFIIIKTISQIESFCDEINALLGINMPHPSRALNKSEKNIEVNQVDGMRDRFREVLWRDYMIYDAVNRI